MKIGKERLLEHKILIRIQFSPVLTRKYLIAEMATNEEAQTNEPVGLLGDQAIIYCEIRTMVVTLACAVLVCLVMSDSVRPHGL